VIVDHMSQNLFYKEFDESRRKSIEEVVRLLSYLNKKLLERFVSPTDFPTCSIH